ncbi:MAG: hypothetical protein IT576_02130 [Verrucomicrobiales bacterium]|nr:hypothetical protein [Verrucomicrobiales bacterium]
MPKPITAKGYALACLLREEAKDCQNDDRAAMLIAAAEEIESLIEEIRGEQKRS